MTEKEFCLSDKILPAYNGYCYLEEDVRKAVLLLKEEITRGVKRNTLFPLDWCMASIDSIFGDLK